MSETETAMTLCADCALPIAVSTPIYFGTFLAFQPMPRCQECLLKLKTAQFETEHLLACPYKMLHWRPKP
jgi:hypothetical protein